MADLNALADRFIEAWNRHDVEALAMLATEDATLTVPGPRVINGREEGKAWDRSWFEAFPDNKITLQHRHIAGNVVIDEYMFEGTQTGPFQTMMGEVPPSGKTLKGPFVNIYEYEGDLVKTSRSYWDNLDLGMQLGLIPTPAGATA